MKDKVLKVIAQNMGKTHEKETGISTSRGFYAHLSNGAVACVNAWYPVGVYDSQWEKLAKANGMDHVKPIGFNVDSIQWKARHDDAKEYDWFVCADVKTLEWHLRAIGENDARVYFNGIYLYPSGHIVATDGFRMHLSGGTGPLGPKGIIVPYRTLKTAIMAAKAQGLTEVTFHGCIIPDDGYKVHFKITCGIFSIFHQSMDQVYPDWQRVLPKDSELGTHIPIDTKALTSEISAKTKVFKAIDKDSSAYASIDGNISIIDDKTHSGHTLVDAGLLADCVAGHKSATFHKNDDKLRPSLITLGSTTRAVLMPVREQ